MSTGYELTQIHLIFRVDTTKHISACEITRLGTVYACLRRACERAMMLVNV